MENYVDEAKIHGGQTASSPSSSSSSSSKSSCSAVTPPGGLRGGGGCNRERMERHWEAVAGRVTVPEEWGHERVLLDEWVDCSTFDELLAPLGVVSARRALVRDQGRKAGSCRSVQLQRTPPALLLGGDPYRGSRLRVGTDKYSGGTQSLS